MSIRLFIVSICLVVLLPVASIAQQNVTSGSLSGRIEDSNGAIVSGANVTATNIETSQRLITNSDQEGRYRFPYLRIGSYDVSVEASGFTAVNKQLTITVGQALELPVRLEVAGVSAQVHVGSEVPLIETVRTQLTETIQPREITDLPLNGRNYLDLALLVPGVSPTNTGSNQRFAETSAVPGQGISVAGQRNLYNSFIVDGVSANDDAADLAGTYYSEEVIDQFQVVTSGGIAEFGRASGGVVNILTRSGTNQWRGNLYGFFRNQRFDARNPLAPTKDLLTQAQYGLSAGGPLRRDRTFFFTNFEQTRRNYSAVLTIAPAAVNTINNRLRAVNYAGPMRSKQASCRQVSTRLTSSPVSITGSTIRNQLSARYSLYHIDAVNSRNVGGLNAVSRGTGIADTDQTLQVSNVTTLSSRTINELRFQYTNSRLDAPVNDETGPAVNIAGVANFGTATFSPLGRDINLVEVVDNVSTQLGDHSLKAGGGFLYNRLNIFFPGAFQGVYNFTSVNNFLNGVYSTYQQAFGVPEQFQSNPNFGVFVQDEWRARRDLTFNAGLRYDVQYLPDPIETDTDNIAPRFGVVYAPGDRKTVIRASYGLYYDRLPLRATSNALQRDGSKYLVVQLSPTQVGAPVFPNVLSIQPSALPTKPNITRIDPNIEVSYSQQANLQIERELPWDAVVSVGYLHLRAKHVILSRNANAPTVPAVSRHTEPRPSRSKLGQHFAVRELGKFLLRRHGRFTEQTCLALGHHASFVHAFEDD